VELLMTVILTNNVSTTLAADITASSVSLTVTDGNRFPTLTSGQYFYATLVAPTGALEIVKVASRVGNVLSIARAQEGTAAQAFPSGARIDMRVTAQSIYDAVDDGAAQVVIDITTELDALEAEDVAINGRVDALDARTDALEAADAALYAPAGSNLVGFLQAGTGATTRTVQGKLRDEVSVLDFGADPTGATSSSTAVQAAINYVQALGGTLVFPRGKYLFTSQVTIDRTYAVSGSNFVGERNLIISGYGAEIRTTGAITAFNVRGGWAPNLTCLIEGFTIYHRGNTTAVGGIRLIGAGLCTCRDITVVVSSLLPVGYAAFSCENLDPANDDTGCFWNYFDNCAIRPWSGAEGNCTYGLKLMGPANATTVRNIKFGGSDTHVILMAHPGYTSAPNAVNIDGNFFEGPVTSTAISLVSSSSPYHVSGTRITNNRFESLNTAVSLTGLGSTVQLPTYMSGNYADTSVTNYLVNASDIPVAMLDTVIVGSPMGPVQFHNQQGVVLRNDDGNYDTLTVRTPNLNSGIKVTDYNGNLLATWRYRSIGGNSGTIIGGTISPFRPFGIVACYGISTNETPAGNLAGTAVFVASATVNVTLQVAEVNANYSVFLENTGNRTLWVTSKTTTGFTINASASSSDSAAWLLIRTGA
jgi:hypothetical protein